MRLTKRCYLLLCLGMVFVMTGCGPVPSHKDTTYWLGSFRATQAPYRAKTRDTLLVAMPIASAGYQTTNMLYMQSPYRLQAFSDNRWVAPPAQMLLPLLVQTFQEKAFFSSVVSYPFSGKTTYRLESRLLRLQQEFLSPVSHIRLSVQVTLIKNDTNSIVAVHTFEVLIPAPSNNPYGGAIAANNAANVICKQIADFCARTLHPK